MLAAAADDDDGHEEESQPAASYTHNLATSTYLATEMARSLAVVYLMCCWRRTGTQGDAVLHWLLGRCIGFRRVQDD